MKVRNGKVRKKNRTDLSPGVFNHTLSYPKIFKRKPGRGYKHLVSVSDMKKFIEILPEWPTISKGLRSIVLDAGSSRTMGWYNVDVVAIRAWEKGIEWKDCDHSFFYEHQEILGKLGIPYSKHGTVFHIEFTEESARAFLLIHVFVHELGHHFDRFTTRGEGYAEAYAKRHEDNIIGKYREAFKFA